MELTHRYGGYKLADGDGIGVNHRALHCAGHNNYGPATILGFTIRLCLLGCGTTSCV